MSFTISGLPDGVQLLQGGDVLVTGGSVTLSADMLDDVSLVVPPAVGDFDLGVTTLWVVEGPVGPQQHRGSDLEVVPVDDPEFDAAAS